MSNLDVLQRLRCAHDGSARPRTAFLHRHLEAAPLVVVMYRLAGESAAPLGVMYGTTPGQPQLLVAPEPRSRQIRFTEVLDPFAADLVRFVQTCADERVTLGKRDVFASAPQLVVPNTATAEFAAPLLGRSLRYLRTEGEYAVPEATVLAGAHLTWLGQQGELPGSSVLLSATELLRRHWVTGVSDLESEDLHVQLAWVDPPNGHPGAAGAANTEDRRFRGELGAAGPTPDPSWDRDVLDPVVTRFNERREGAVDHRTVSKLAKPVREVVEAALRPTWDATWRTIELLRALPVAPSVDKRWNTDRLDFTNHFERVETGEARFRTRDSVKQAAYVVSRRERAQAELEAGEALDDPLVMAGAVSDGQALTGTVVRVDRPFVEIELSSPCIVPTGTSLYWSELDGKCSVVVTEATTGPPHSAVLETYKGKTKYYPDVGQRVIYAPFKTSQIWPPKMPPSVPWTHQGPENPVPEPETAE